MKNSLEGIVIKWAFQVDEVLKETSLTLFEKNAHPTPTAERKFWENRRKNVMNIYDQLKDPRVKKIGSILEQINSVYFTTFSTTFKNIVTALHEANDITLYLKPLQTHFDRIENAEFLEIEEKLRPFYHCICLTWAHSKYYGLNSRMIVLFRMINNMMISIATRYLDPDSLFKKEPDESLVNLQKVIKILEEHKICFKEYRDKLPSFVLPERTPIMWTFRPKDIFERFDYFMKRLYVIRDIFETANEFYKIEKIEIGGLRGRNLSRSIQQINNEFKNLYSQWSQIESEPLDPDPQLKLFDRERRKFQNEAETMERRLAALLVQAFDECFTLESLIKLIQVCGSLLQRPIIYHEIKDRLNNMLELYNKDLDAVKGIFNSGTDAIARDGLNSLPVDKGFPPVAGALTWIKKMRVRIKRPTEDFPNIELKGYALGMLFILQSRG